MLGESGLSGIIDALATKPSDVSSNTPIATNTLYVVISQQRSLLPDAPIKAPVS